MLVGVALARSWSACGGLRISACQCHVSAAVDRRSARATSTRVDRAALARLGARADAATAEDERAGERRADARTGSSHRSPRSGTGLAGGARRSRRAPVGAVVDGGRLAADCLRNVRLASDADEVPAYSRAAPRRPRRPPSRAAPSPASALPARRDARSRRGAARCPTGRRRSRATATPTSASEPAMLPAIASMRAGKSAEVLLRLGNRRAGDRALERHRERDADREAGVDERDGRRQRGRRARAASLRRAAAASAGRRRGSRRGRRPRPSPPPRPRRSRPAPSAYAASPALQASSCGARRARQRAASRPASRSASERGREREERFHARETSVNPAAPALAS